MEQKFTKLDDGKVKWEYTREEQNHEDKEFGKVGIAGGYDYIIFDSKAQALAVLDRDEADVNNMIEQYTEELRKNEHNLDRFKDLKDLIEQVAKLNSQFQEISTDKVYGLYSNDAKKYQKLYSEFNKSKEYIKDEIAILNKEYQKFLNSSLAQKNLDFATEQMQKIQEQKTKLLNI